MVIKNVIFKLRMLDISQFDHVFNYISSLNLRKMKPKETITMNAEKL